MFFPGKRSYAVHTVKSVEYSVIFRDLSNNQIKYLDQNSFPLLPELETLLLSFNRSVSHIFKTKPLYYVICAAKKLQNLVSHTIY